MRKQLVYDIPTRMFHWIFSLLFVAAFAIAYTVSHRSPLFPLHMLAGITLSFVVFLRIVWGFIGTRHSRFSEFPLKPTHLIQYLKGVLTGDKHKWDGHNPASSWAALAMMAMALSLGVTGYLMTSGSKTELIEEIHEYLAYAFLITAVMHIAGVALHTFRHRDNIGLSMIDGYKMGISPEATIPSARKISGVIFLIVFTAFVTSLVSGFDPDTRKLNSFGFSLSLGKKKQKSANAATNETSNKGLNKNFKFLKPLK